MERVSRLVHRVAFEEFRDAEQERERGGFQVERFPETDADRERAEDGDAHQQVDVEVPVAKRVVAVRDDGLSADEDGQQERHVRDRDFYAPDGEETARADDGGVLSREEELEEETERDEDAAGPRLDARGLRQTLSEWSDPSSVSSALVPTTS